MYRGGFQKLLQDLHLDILDTYLLIVKKEEGKFFTFYEKGQNKFTFGTVGLDWKVITSQVPFISILKDALTFQ